MAEAIDDSLHHLSEDDLRAIAYYLKSVPAMHDPADTRPVFAWGEAADDLNSIRGVALPQDPDQMTGPRLYDAYCATCHQARAQGSFDGGLPALFHNTALGRHDANNLVMIMLACLHRKPDVFMPPFARDLSDQQLATLASYLTRRYGNPQASVTAKKVRTLRVGGGAGNLLPAIWIGLVAVSLLIFAALFWLVRRQRGRRL